MELSVSPAKSGEERRSVSNFRRRCAMRDFRTARVSKRYAVQQTSTLLRTILAALLLPWIVSTTGCLFSSAKPAPRAFHAPPVEAKAVVVIPEVPILEEAGPAVDGPEPVPNPAELATIPIP